MFICLSSIGASWNDISRLNKESIHKIIEVRSEHDVIEAIKYARLSNKKIVVSGTRHSQGGHIAYPDAIVLDMRKFNKILKISSINRTVTVQSGSIWNDVQKAINSYGFAVKVMQSSNIFSIGGSISANVHGRDPNYGPLIETINKLKLILSDGRVVYASRELNQELFKAVIGGYGSIAIILEVELSLTKNHQLKKSTKQVYYNKYISNVMSNFKDANITLQYGRCSIVKNSQFLRDCYLTYYEVIESKPVVDELLEEESIRRNKLLFSLSRHSDLGKKIRWSLQKKIIDVPGKTELISRNNAMRPPIKFLTYESKTDTDILQEYFVPTIMFNDFMDDLRKELIVSDVNLLSMTLRYLRNSQESLMSYSRQDMMAIVLYINIDMTEDGLLNAKKWTRNIVDLVLKYQGVYYLTYQRFPTVEQFRQAYPHWSDYKNTKIKYDPDGILYNRFYEQYIDNIIRSKAGRR